MFAVSARNLVRVRARPVTSILWMLLWVAAAVAVAEPDLTTQAARVLGIQRGADLLGTARYSVSSLAFISCT